MRKSRHQVNEAPLGMKIKRKFMVENSKFVVHIRIFQFKPEVSKAFSFSVLNLFHLKNKLWANYGLIDISVFLPSKNLKFELVLCVCV